MAACWQCGVNGAKRYNKLLHFSVPKGKNNDMHHIIDLWTWLLADNASRATVILVLITGLYVILTGHMTRAIARQTRAMIQPVALVRFHWKEKKFYPDSSV